MPYYSNHLADDELPVVIRTRKRRQKQQTATVIPESLFEAVPLHLSKTLTLSTEEEEVGNSERITSDNNEPPDISRSGAKVRPEAASDSLSHDGDDEEEDDYDDDMTDEETDFTTDEITTTTTTTTTTKVKKLRGGVRTKHHNSSSTTTTSPRSPAFSVEEEESIAPPVASPQSRPNRRPRLYDEDDDNDLDDVIRHPPPHHPPSPRWHHWFEIFPAKLLGRKTRKPLEEDEANPVIMDDIHVWPPPHSDSPYSIQEVPSGFHPSVRASRIKSSSSVINSSDCMASSTTTTILMSTLVALLVILLLVVFGLTAIIFKYRRGRNRRRKVSQCLSLSPAPGPPPPNTECGMSLATAAATNMSSPKPPTCQLLDTPPPPMQLCVNRGQSPTSLEARAERSSHKRHFQALQRFKDSRFTRGRRRCERRRKNTQAEEGERLDESRETRCNSLPCACISTMVTPIMPQASAPPPAESETSFRPSPIIPIRSTADNVSLFNKSSRHRRDDSAGSGPWKADSMIRRTTPSGKETDLCAPSRDGLCVGEELELLRPPLKQEVVHRWEKSYSSSDNQTINLQSCLSSRHYTKGSQPIVPLDPSAISSQHSSKFIFRDASSAGEFKTPRETGSEGEHSNMTRPFTLNTRTTPPVPLTPPATGGGHWRHSLLHTPSPCFSSGDNMKSSSDCTPPANGLCARPPRDSSLAPPQRGRPPLPNGKRYNRSLTDADPTGGPTADISPSPSTLKSRVAAMDIRRRVNSMDRERALFHQPSDKKRRRRDVKRQRAMTDETPLLQHHEIPCYERQNDENSDMSRLVQMLHSRSKRGRPSRLRIPRSLDRVHLRSSKRKQQRPCGVHGGGFENTDMRKRSPSAAQRSPLVQTNSRPSSFHDYTPRPIKHPVPNDCGGEDVRRRPPGLCCVLGDRIYRIRRSSSLEHDYLYSDEEDDSSSYTSSPYNCHSLRSMGHFDDNLIYSSTIGDSDSIMHFGAGPITTGPETSTSLDDEIDCSAPSVGRWTHARVNNSPCLMRVTHFDTPRPQHNKHSCSCQ